MTDEPFDADVEDPDDPIVEETSKDLADVPTDNPTGEDGRQDIPVDGPLVIMDSEEPDLDQCSDEPEGDKA